MYHYDNPLVYSTCIQVQKYYCLRLNALLCENAFVLCVNVLSWEFYIIVIDRYR